MEVSSAKTEVCDCGGKDNLVSINQLKFTKGKQNDVNKFAEIKGAGYQGTSRLQDHSYTDRNSNNTESSFNVHGTALRDIFL